tara:strand:+ start:126 stop:311 length:186 start_codon:yes stop_codon:yes gene_type:complete
MHTLQLINNFPTLTPMEENQTNLETTITMMMIIGQLSQEPVDQVRDTLIIAAAAMLNPAEA